MMQKFLGIHIVFIILFWSFGVHAQNPKLDRLEMWYAQGHYQKVHRKANKLLDLPEYDYSIVPTYYKSISLIQLCQNDFWLEKHYNSISVAGDLFQDVKVHPDGPKLLEAHVSELSWLKKDMMQWASDLKLKGDDETFVKVQDLIDYMFSNVEIRDIVKEENVDHVDSAINTTNIKGIRAEIVSTAKKQLGVPYVWAGNTPDGFDCSGFTSYVMGEHGQSLPRRASDQYDSATKIKEKNVKPGDLVFFNNGSGISHVGIVVSQPGEPLTMIHSSSSKGIILTNVSASEYWLKRLHGYGTYVK